MARLNRNYLMCCLFFFFFFICWGACYPYLSLWLTDTIGVSYSDVGLVYSFTAIVSVCIQPVFGFISDKLKFRKNLMWMLAIIMVLFAPYWIYVFAPLMKYNVILGALAGGIYIGFAFGAGCGVCEAYIDKVSRMTGFEFGRARMFGGLGAAFGTFLAGELYGVNQDYIFWMASLAGIFLLFVVYMTDPKHDSSCPAPAEGKAVITRKDVTELLKTRRFWFFAVYMVGVGAVYETYDQQFAIYYSRFFATKAEGAAAFGYLYTAQIFLDAVVMFFAPWFVNKIGPKNALLYCGMIMSIRIIGSAYAVGPVSISAIKMLHGFESSVFLVAGLKYISANFPAYISATVYLIGFQFSKQFSAIFLSGTVGHMYNTLDFRDTYIILGLIALGFTLLSFFTLSPMRQRLTQEAVSG